ncbi:MAG: DUF2934 domain-containing protein [Candidatus Kryptonium sp.]|nr:DUF2934 domain-containing protein [Candidatus Kryptonium sp.]MCX7762442.1 DUF2934 domain-containing protein [Candidatus Kryptonium sp.]MDW8109931.1 DUF2934 domain-containing protein [Candidatus Kryptonium sp.]
MAKKIKKSDVEQFLIDFSRKNQFKPMVVESASGRKRERILEGAYFLGFHCKTEVGSKDKVYLFKATTNYQFIGEIVFEIDGLEEISFNKGTEIEEVSLKSDKSKKYIVKVFGRPNDEMRRETIAKVAYFIWERKGGIGTQDLENWAEAERIVQDWSRIFSDGFIKV